MTDTDNQPDPTPTDTAAPADGLGEAGKKAIAAERARATAAEKQLKALQMQLDDATSQLSNLTAANGDLTAQLSDREKANLRLTVGLEKGLPKGLIDRLKGDDEETLAADADALLELLPTAPAAGSSSSPRPDPSQGARGPGKSTPAQEFAQSIGSLFTT